ncbi:MAG: SMC-Scp complex subunit ScpB [Candidatus Nanohaloarchaea archaeon]|nr:SMC-Scp complex subunit ScpB [Candidatus Nanohaloarchaea archaeon]
MDEKKAILEAALYVADEPLDTNDIADLMNLGSRGFVQNVIDELRDDLEASDRGLELIETSEGYRLQVKHQFVEQVKDVAPHQDLSDAALRTLSLIAYNAPVQQTKIIDIRGNRAYDHVKELEARDLISSEKDGRTKSLDVTDSFLDYFNLDSLQEFRDSFDAETAEEFMEETGDGIDGSEADGSVDEPQDETQEHEDPGQEIQEEADSETPATEKEQETGSESEQSDEQDEENVTTTIEPPTR